MNKEELLSEVEKLEKEFNEKIAELKSQVNSIEIEGIKKGVRQMPEVGDKYFFINSDGLVIWSIWRNNKSDLFHFNTGNCFKTEEEAEDYKENLLTKQALKDLALELNNGVEIDWQNLSQSKFYIYLNFDCKRILNSDDTTCYKELGGVHCLDENFLTIAKDRMGEERLIKLIKSGV